MLHEGLEGVGYEMNGYSLILVATDLIFSTVRKGGSSCCGVVPDQLHGYAVHQPDEQHPVLV